jgi:hypothetical protein
VEVDLQLLLAPVSLKYYLHLNGIFLEEPGTTTEISLRISYVPAEVIIGQLRKVYSFTASLTC